MEAKGAFISFTFGPWHMALFVSWQPHCTVGAALTCYPDQLHKGKKSSTLFFKQNKSKMQHTTFHLTATHRFWNQLYI